jgi:ankyrin repeat protein
MQGPILSNAAQYGKVPMARYLLDEFNNAFSVHDQDHNGFRPLLSAAVNGQLEMTDFLITRGALLNHRDDLGRTALMDAAGAEKFSVVRLLLFHGAYPCMRTIALEEPGTVSEIFLSMPAIRALLTMRSAGLVYHLSKFAKIRLLPEGLCRMIGALLV